MGPKGRMSALATSYHRAPVLGWRLGAACSAAEVPPAQSAMTCAGVERSTSPSVALRAGGRLLAGARHGGFDLQHPPFHVRPTTIHPQGGSFHAQGPSLHPVHGSFHAQGPSFHLPHASFHRRHASFHAADATMHVEHGSFCTLVMEDSISWVHRCTQRVGASIAAMKSSVFTMERRTSGMDRSTSRVDRWTPGIGRCMPRVGRCILRVGRCMPRVHRSLSMTLPAGGRCGGSPEYRAADARTTAATQAAGVAFRPLRAKRRPRSSRLSSSAPDATLCSLAY